MIEVSRIYVIDGNETCILVSGDNAQAALRNLDAAAEQLGAAPTPVPFSGAAPKRQTRARGTTEVSPKEEAAPSPTMPPITAAFDPPPPTVPPVTTAFEPPPRQAGPFSGPAPQPPLQVYGTPSLNGAMLTDAPPVPLGQTQVGLAPSPYMPPPVFPAPPPPQDAAAQLRKHLVAAREGVLALVEPQPGWRASVEQTLDSLFRVHDLPVLNEAQLSGILGQVRQYEDVLRRHMGML